MNAKTIIVIIIAIAMVGAATVSYDITPADAKRKGVSPKFFADEVGNPGSGVGFKQKSECNQFRENAQTEYTPCYKAK